MKKLNRILFSLLTVGLGISLCSCGGPKKYVITWENYDGTVLEIDNDVVEGSMPSYDGNTPTKAGNAQYTFTFSGWSPSITTVTGDKTYTAQFSNTTNSYTITWDVEGSKTTETYKYGETPSYKKGTPTKAGNAQYTYTFSGWSPSITTVTGDKTYTAQFSNTTNSYTITWKNYDGSVIKTTSSAYGTMPSFGGTPTRENDATHYYTFTGWQPSLTSVTGNATYTAQYQQNESTSFEIKYNLNGGSGSISSQTKSKNSSLKLRTTVPTYEGHIFVGWNNIYENKVYQPGDNFELNCNLTLWAMWGEDCSHCNHTGKVTSTSSCSHCYGRGRVCANCGNASQTIIQGYGAVCSSCFSSSTKTCSWCSGQGTWTNTYDCSYCEGLKYEKEAAPVVATAEARKIVLKSLNGYEYSLDGNKWQSSNVFENLKPSTTYNFFQRRATKDNIPFGLTSKKLSTSTSSTSTFFVTYELNGGTNNPSNPSTYSSSGSSKTLYNPTKEHYDFVGWTYKGNTVTSISPSWNEDITLVANWKATGYSISYNLNGGSASNPTSHGIESEEITLNNPTRNGYTFTGWTGSNGTEPSTNVTIEAGNTENLSYTANWSLNTYKITYDLNGGENSSENPSSYTVEDDNIVLKNPTREHYDFAGWKNGSSSITRIYTSNAKDYVLTATWKPHNYSITYQLDGGINNSNNPSSHTIESSTINLEDPTRNGYTFTGWTGSNGTEPSTNVTIEAGNTENLSYTANWSLNTYSITYELYGGKNAAKNPNSYTIEDTITLKDATKDYYTFEGWYKEPAFINKVETLNGQSGNLILYAKFTPYEFCANYDLNGGSSSLETCKLTFDFNLSGVSNKEVILKTGDSFDIYSIELPKTNKVFLGWFDKPNYEFDSLISYDIYSIYNGFELKGDTTLYALWSDKDLGTALYPGFSFNGYGDKTVYVPAIYSGVMNISGYAGSSLNYINCEYAATEYFPSSWSEFEYGPLFVLKIHNGSPSSYMRFTSMERRKVNVVYNEPTTKEYFGEAFSNPKSERTGYDFAGWYDENNELAHDTWDYTEDKNFHAEWTIHNYSVTYNLNGGVNNSSNPSSFVYTDYIELLNPYRDGYTFAGWYADSTFSNKITHINGSKYSDVELYAKWIPNTYTTYLDYDGGQNCPTINFYSQGSIIKTIDLYKDSTLDYFVPESPSENLKFGGWYTDSSCTQLFSFDGTINADTSLYAKWIDVSNYQYSQLGNNVEVQINNINYGYIAICSPINQTITITSSSGLDLYGAIYDSNWNMIASCDDISDENLDFSIKITLKAGKIYYIGYKANQVSTSGDCVISISGTNFSETFITGDYTQIIESISVTYDSSFELPTPKKEGYEFIGWFDENGNPIDTSLWKYTENITIYAHWRAI